MMDRSREARRAAGMVASSNGLSRRRHRSNSLRDSPDEDGPVELQESVRLRERVKKDRDRDRDRERDRERDRDRDRERERERERERSSRSSKRRRGERLMIHGSTRDDAGDDTSEESVNDDEEDEDEDNNHSNNNGHHTGGGIGGGVRLLPPNPNAGSAAASSISNHYHSSSSNNHHHHNNSNNHNHHHQHLQHRKSFPPSAGAAKVFRAAPVWKSGDEMIGVSVPRKARSASIKRSHDWMSNSTGGNSGVVVGGVGVEQIHRQASTSPVRQNIVSTPPPPPPPAAPMSPSSSNASARKKIKPNGPKQPRPPKSSSKASSSNPEELEIEIAEVLSGLKTQSQAPPKKEILSNDSTEVNRSSSDAKSRVSSPISNSPSTNIQSSPAILPPNSCSSAGPLSAIAPKRKRPRQVSESPGGYSVRSSPISSTAKMEIDQTPKADVSSPNLEKAPGSEAENGYDLGNLVNSQGSPPELPLPELLKADSELKPAAEGLGESRDVIPKEELISSPKEESPAVRAEESNREDEVTATALASVTTSSAVSEVDAQREKFQIDLEAPPPQLRSSPERESEIFSMASAVDHKPVVYEELKPVLAKDKEDEKVVKMGKEAAVTVGADEMKAKLAVEESESQKRGENKVRNIDLQLDLEKPERDTGMSSRLPPQGVKQQQQLQPSKAAKEEPHGEKTGHPSSLPLPMSMASWPGGLPPMGYMAPIQGVVSMDGSTVSPAPIQPFFSQPRPKRCATHCYIARNIHYLQQLMKMNPFWPPAAAAASSASLFGSKPLSVVPPAELQGNIAGRAVNSAQDKAQGLAIFPGHGGKDKSSQPANIADASQRKQQILLQQALPPVAPNNILHGPAFIFPLNQQPAAVAAASARPGSIKPPASSSNLASTSASNTAASSASATAGGGAAAVSFNYPNMTANETQYLAILQNNAYPFPIPAAVGAPPNYRGTHPQALPMFNGSFYSSQIIHPSQLQQPQQPVSQSQQMQQNHQNPSVSSGSSSSQKHLQSQQQRPAGSALGGGNGSGNLHNFPAPKNRQSQQSQQPHNQQITPSQARQLENEVGAEDSPSTADSRGARGPMNIYGQNFAMPIHPQNYALLATPAALANATATTGSSNQSEKKHQQAQQQGKNGVESLPPQTFAMSFASINGASSAPGIDLSSMAQNHAILQSLPEATRHNIQIMAATAAAQAAHRKNFRMSEDGKAGGVDSSNTEDERKGLSGKSPATTSQSIAFSRSELTDASGSATAANNVIDSSTRSLNLASGPAWTARSTMPNSVGAASVSNAQLQAQHQPQQMMQLHKQQQLAAASGARNKTPATSNGSVYPDHLSSASSMAKFPNSLSGFPQNLVQTSNSSSPAQSPQWKNSARTNTSQASSSFVTSTTSSLKSLPQQQGRTQQSHTQISFGANQKASASPQGQQAPSSIQSPSSPMMVGSPSTSSISKGTGGSPRTTSASASSKTGQVASLSSQQAKNSSHPGQKSSPVSGRNVPSILGNPHVASTSNSGPKSQMQQQQQQHQQQHQQLPKNMQQAQLFFSNPYMQSQSQHSTNTNVTAASGGYYIQRRRPDQQQQQPPGTSAGSSTGMLTLCPVSLAGAGTSDPAKAIAAATVAASNMKGGGLPSQSILHAAQFAAQSAGNQHQLLPTGFPYVHPVPAAVQVKPAEQKQPAGNDNLHACWQPEKK